MAHSNVIVRKIKGEMGQITSFFFMGPGLEIRLDMPRTFTYHTRTSSRA